MNSCPVVLVAFFDKIASTELYFGDNACVSLAALHGPDETVLGLPLYRVNGHAVFRWAIDYVTCSDIRWVVFGPFASASMARSIYENHLSKLKESLGFHVVNEHCLMDKYGERHPDGTEELPHWAWTDG